MTRRLRSVGMVIVAIAASTASPAQQRTRVRAPIIDVHVHALGAADQGPPPVAACPGTGSWTAPARADSFGLADLMQCRSPLRSPRTDDEIMRQTLALMERYNVIGVVSGRRQRVLRWKEAAPVRVVLGSEADPPDSLRAWAAAGTMAVIGELGFQYAGLAPGDSLPERYFALAEALDVPLGYHVGLGPPGAPYIGAPGYRMRLSNPLLLEETLVRHRRLRLYVMHAGWPFLEEMVALLYAHPQVYVDLGVIDWVLPRAEFHRYLRRLVEAGFGKRIMFGSDQMVWPEALRIAIENVEAAEFLTSAQKRDILYNNAARFLRLDSLAGRGG